MSTESKKAWRKANPQKSKEYDKDRRALVENKEQNKWRMLSVRRDRKIKEGKL